MNLEKEKEVSILKDELDAINAEMNEFRSKQRSLTVGRDSKLFSDFFQKNDFTISVATHDNGGLQANFKKTIISFEMQEGMPGIISSYTILSKGLNEEKFTVLLSGRSDYETSKQPMNRLQKPMIVSYDEEISKLKEKIKEAKQAQESLVNTYRTNYSVRTSKGVTEFQTFGEVLKSLFEK